MKQRSCASLLSAARPAESLTRACGIMMRAVAHIRTSSSESTGACSLSGVPGTATNAMVLFLAINTSNVSLLPLGVMGVRAAVGSQDVAGIVLTTFLATLFSTLVGIAAAVLLSRLPANRATEPAAPATVDERGEISGSGGELLIQFPEPMERPPADE